MKRRQRCEILIRGSHDLAEQMAADVLQKHEVKLIEEPSQGMILVKVRETARRTLFYLGEVLVTECKVAIGDAFGIGLINGIEPDLAYHLAVIDAAYNASLPLVASWQPALAEAEAQLLLQDEAERAGIAQTKVSFETMDVSE